MNPQLQAEVVHAAIIGGAIVLGLLVCYVILVGFIASKIMKRF
jgi:hypothetical protein